MSMVAKLHEDDACWCPACGETLDDVSLEGDPCGEVDGKPEYYVVCPFCGCSFYASECYE